MSKTTKPPEATVEGLTVTDIRTALVKSPLKQAGHGSVPAATRLTSLLEELEQQQQAGLHRERMAQIGSNTIALAEYLGELGVDPDEAERTLRQPLTQDPIVARAYEQGQRTRIMEARAIERHRAKMTGEVPEWMNRHYQIDDD